MRQLLRERFGVTREMIQAGVSTPEFIELMKLEVDRAEEFLISGASVIDKLPLLIQIDIELFAAGGLCILERIRKIGYCLLEQRPVVTKWDGVWLLCSASNMRNSSTKATTPAALCQQHSVGHQLTTLFDA